MFDNIHVSIYFFHKIHFEAMNLLFLSFAFVYSHVWQPGPEVIKLEYSLKLKIKHTDWLLADTCLQAANHYALF